MCFLDPFKVSSFVSSSSLACQIYSKIAGRNVTCQRPDMNSVLKVAMEIAIKRSLIGHIKAYLSRTRLFESFKFTKGCLKHTKNKNKKSSMINILS